MAVLRVRSQCDKVARTASTRKEPSPTVVCVSAPAELSSRIGDPHLERPTSVQVRKLEEDSIPSGSETEDHFHIVRAGYMTALSGRDTLTVHPQDVGIIRTQQECGLPRRRRM